MDLTPYIDNPRLLNRETLVDLRRLTEEFPFYQAARLLYVQNLFMLHESAFGEQMRRASMMIPDRSVLFQMVEEEPLPAASADTRRQSRSPIVTENEDRTTSLIDGFLSDLPHEAADDSASPHTMPTVADVTSDYASFLAQQHAQAEEETPAAEADPSPEGEKKARANMSDLIDNFLDATRGKQRYQLPDETDTAEPTTPAAVPPPDTADSPIYNEKIVGMLLQQGHYEQALDILKRICLNNPEKSTIFATQISLLEVIVNQQNGRKTAKQ